MPYKSPLQPYMAWATLGALCLVIFFSGYTVFFPGRWSVSTFLTYYIDIAIFIGKPFSNFPGPEKLLTVPYQLYGSEAGFSSGQSLYRCAIWTYQKYI